MEVDQRTSRLRFLPPRQRFSWAHSLRKEVGGKRVARCRFRLPPLLPEAPAGIRGLLARALGASAAGGALPRLGVGGGGRRRGRRGREAGAAER